MRDGRPAQRHIPAAEATAMQTASREELASVCPAEPAGRAPWYAVAAQRGRAALQDLRKARIGRLPGTFAPAPRTLAPSRRVRRPTHERWLSINQTTTIPP